MSVLMVGPGPLEGGPMVSPGPAKSGDNFSAHFKQACDPPKRESTPDTVKPTVKQSGQDAVPAKDNKSSRSGAASSQKTRTSNSRPPSVEKGDVPHPTSESQTDVAAENAHTETTLPQNADPATDPGSTNVLSAEVIVPVELGAPQGDEPLLAVIPLVSGTDPNALSAESTEEPPADSKTEKKEEPNKSETKPVDGLTPVPLLIPLAVVLPVPAQETVQENTSQGQPAEDIAVVPVALESVNGPALPPQGPTLVNVPEKDMGVPEKRSDPKSSLRPKDMPEPTKKGEGVPTVLPANPNDTASVERPELHVMLDPAVKEKKTAPSSKETVSQDRDVRKEIRPVDETPLPVPIVEPDVVPQVPLSKDAVAKLKETLTITSLRQEVSAPLGMGPLTASSGVSYGNPANAGASGVSDISPVNAGRPAVAPVVEPSPVDLARQIHVHLESGRSVVRIDLHPDHLGELRISMETKGKDVSMQFTVDNDNARTAVVAGLREITGTLSTLGWSVNGLAVNVSSGGVGNGRGESNGPLWGPGQKISNEESSTPQTPRPQSVPGSWRVDLVA